VPLEAGSNKAIGMHADLVEMYMRTTALLVQPIAPHFAEHLHCTILGSTKSVQQALWTEIPVVNSSHVKEKEGAYEAGLYMRATVKSARDAEIALARKSKKGTGTATGTGGIKSVRLIVATSFPRWQDDCVGVIKELLGNSTDAANLDDGKLKEALSAGGLLKDKRVMPFVQTLKKRITAEGVALALSRQLTFDEDKVLRLISPYIAASMNLPGGAEVVTQDVARTKIVADEDGWKGSANTVENAEPRNPGIHFWTRHA